MSEESKFEEYLLSEYSNIAQAHFKSIETISTFFRYYLLIMSIPASAVALVSQITQDVDQLTTVVNQYRVPISIVLFCISFVGLGVFCYIVNLRLDVVLYARTVNGIRKFFYDGSDVDINLKLRMRSLPQSPQLPSYSEKSYFFPVVAVFGIMNSLYFGSAEYIYLKILWLTFTFTVIFLCLHFLVYLWYAEHREIAYLKSSILGVDIDGVLNKHREHFCKLLKENTGKELDPEQILIMPVHEYAALNVTREDEKKVFNDPKYWRDMPAIENASDRIRTLIKAFKLKVYIFTHRPWPDSQNKKELIEAVNAFCQQASCCSLRLFLLKKLVKLKFLPTRRLTTRWKEEPLKQISKVWLKGQGIYYDKFIFEKGNDYSSDPRGKFNNRFYISRKKKIRFFVEDDLEKAVKLSYICDIVFLLSHPYNEPQQVLPDEDALRKNFPSNIIRVKSWNEIYKNIRRLS
ncbi:MAG: hypothetical protein NTX52_14175 [Planctomycetota bacterium]|nr:hypothetical protein [Planctomycetota bacterium]